MDQLSVNTTKHPREVKGVAYVLPRPPGTFFKFLLTKNSPIWSRWKFRGFFLGGLLLLLLLLSSLFSLTRTQCYWPQDSQVQIPSEPVFNLAKKTKKLMYSLAIDRTWLFRGERTGFGAGRCQFYLLLGVWVEHLVPLSLRFLISESGIGTPTSWVIIRTKRARDIMRLFCKCK